MNVGEDICHTCIKEFVSRIYKELQQINGEKTDKPFLLKWEQTGTSQKKIPKWSTSIEKCAQYH